MKNTAVRRSFKRTIVILTAFGLFSVYLLFNILRLDVFMYDHYKEKTYDQVTTTSPLPARRGMIYDANMNALALSNTVWRIFISTKDIRTAEKEGRVGASLLIAEGLSEILSMDKEAIYKKIVGSSVLDVTIKRDADEDEYKKTLEFIKKHSLEELLFTEAQSSRYYPEGTLAAHTLGFTGSDNQGLYGLEYFYDDLLRGEDGYYVYAKDASGKALDTEYSEYFPPTDGYSLVTTLDKYVQEELEAIIETARINHGVENRVTGVVMDVRTGGILAMATTSPFDPNDPFTLDELSAKRLEESGYEKGSDEYSRYKSELLGVMWSNKAISETYEPGSTFKIVTVSAALDAGVCKPTDSFSCNGYAQIGGYRIRCHKIKGHGQGFSLAYGLQMSCNPCMIAVSERLGAKDFYSYVKKFGYLEKCGIDLPGEATTIFHKEDAIGTTELATASFGQRFKVTVINQLTAIAAVANGGRLVTPYVVDKVIDSEGRVISDRGTDVRRTVISEETAETVSKILIEGVNGDGGAKNAGVSGYDVAAKTGTSQKFDILDENGNSYLRVGSTVAYSTDSERGIAAIIVVDEPTSSVKYGSVVAAPYVSALFEKILPYLDFISNADSAEATVESYVGLHINTARKKLEDLGISYEVVGGGDTVLSQTPSASDVITYPISKVILYTERTVSESVTVPTLTGLSLSDAVKCAINSGLNIRLLGIGASAASGGDLIAEQSLSPGSVVKRGTVIAIRAINGKYED